MNVTENLDADPVPELLRYCQERQVYINPKICPKRVEGRGLGVYATGRLIKGERLIHVPTATLFTTRRVPNSFANAHARKSIPVHALLAAYFAFGDDEQHRSLAPWMATWPKLSDFTASMPMTWNPLSRTGVGNLSSQKLDSEAPPSESSGFSPIPPPLIGSYLSFNDSTMDGCGSTTLVSAQLSKFRAHVSSLKPILDSEVYHQLQDPYSPSRYRFIHAWLCVNTRCFSYTTPGTKRPSDPNEAMALCPGMDLFNHAATPSVKTKYDRSGYFTVADRAHEVGEEILFNYGHHVNDVLWTEYGFLLDELSYDAIRIDKLVLAGLDEKQRGLLEHHGYLNDYWLTKDGVCWRTEVVGWLSVLSQNQWESMLEGNYDPEADETIGKHQVSEKKILKRKRQGLVAAHRLICASWIARVEKDARVSLKGLSTMSMAEVLQILGDSDSAIRNQRSHDVHDLSDAEVQEIKTKEARERHAMCVKRWTQLLELGTRAREATETVK